MHRARGLGRPASRALPASRRSSWKLAYAWKHCQIRIYRLGRRVGGGAEDFEGVKKRRRRAVCLVSGNAMSLREWAHAEARHGRGSGLARVTSSDMPRALDGHACSPLLVVDARVEARVSVFRATHQRYPECGFRRTRGRSRTRVGQIARGDSPRDDSEFRIAVKDVPSRRVVPRFRRCGRFFRRCRAHARTRAGARRRIRRRAAA